MSSEAKAKEMRSSSVIVSAMARILNILATLNQEQRQAVIFLLSKDSA